MPIYNLNGELYDIPENVAKDFEKDNPGATTTYSVNGDVYDIPVSEREGFLSAFPNAVEGEQAKPSTGEVLQQSLQQRMYPTGKPEEKPQQKQAAGGYTPSAAERAQFQQTLNKGQQALASNSRSLNRIDYLSKRRGLDVQPVHVGQNRKVVEEDKHLNPETGELESTYLTEQGNRYNRREGADLEQNTADINDYQQSLPGQLDAAYKERDSINEMLRERRQQLDEEKRQQPWYTKMLKELAAGSRPDAAYPEQIYDNDEQYQQLMAAYRKNNELIQTLEDAKNGDTNGFWHSLGTEIANGYTFSLGGKAKLDDFSAKVNAMQNVESINKKRASGEELTEDEKVSETVLKNMAWDNEVQRMYGDQYGAWARAGKMGAVSADFMIDFLMMGGQPLSLAKQISSKIVDLGGNFAMKGFGKYMMKTLGATVGSLVAGAEISNTVQANKTLVDAAGRYIGDVAQNENGDYVFGHYEEGDDGNPKFVEGGEDILSSALGAERTAISENASEIVGGFMPGGEAILKGMSKIGLGKVASGLTALSGKGWYQAYSRALETMGFNGVPGEALEEYAGMAFDAMMGGDEWKGLADPRTHVDIWLGTATMGALLNAPRMAGTSYQTAQYFRYKHNANKSDKVAASIIGDEVWEPLREQIDSTPNEQMTDVAMSIINNDNLQDEQKKAALDYVQNLQKTRGYGFGLVADSREDADAAGEQTSQSYVEGYNISEPQDMNDARNRLEMAREKLIDAFEPSYASEFEIDPVQALRHTVNTDFSDEQKQAAMDFVNAKMTYEGMVDAVNDDIETKIAISDATIDKRRNPSDNAVHPATLITDAHVYIIGGHIVMTDDGTAVNRQASRDANGGDNMILTVNAETGKVEPHSVEEFLSVDEPIDADQMKEEARQNIIATMSQEADNKIDGVLPFQQGDEYTVLGEDGMEHHVQVFEDQGDGTVAVYMDGNPQAELLDKQSIQQMADNYNLARLQQEAEQNSNISAEASAEAEETVETPTALSRIPIIKDAQGQPVLDRGGNPQYMWHEAPVADTVEALMEQTEGNMVMARDTANAMVAKAKSDKEKIKKVKVTGNDPLSMIQSRKANEQAEQQAQSIVKYWQDVAQNVQRMMDEESARLTAEREAAKTEEQRANEAKAEAERKQRIDEQERERIREQIEKDREKRNKEYEPITKARQELADDAEAVGILDDAEPRDLSEWVSSLLRPHSLLWQDEQAGEHTVTGLRSELGLQRNDMQRFVSLLAQRSNGGKPFAEIVDEIHEGLPEAMKEQYTDQDVRNSLLDLFNEGSASRMMNLAKEHRIEEAREMYKANRRRETEAEMDAWSEFYHLTPEERQTYEDYMQQPPSEPELTIINQIISEDEQNRTSPAVGTEPNDGTVPGSVEGSESQVQAAAEAAGSEVNAEGSAQGAEAATGEPPVSDNAVPGTKQSREYLRTLFEQIGVEDATLSDRMGDYDVEQLNALVEDWEAVNDDYGQIIGQQEEAMKSKNKAVRDKAKAIVDEAEQRANKAFEPVAQYIESLQAKYATESEEFEGAIPTPPVDKPRYDANRQALVDAYRSGDASAITAAAQDVQQYVDEGLDSYGEESDVFDIAEEYDGNDPEMLADQYIIRTFWDRYLDDDEDQDYIKTGLKMSMRTAEAEPQEKAEKSSQSNGEDSFIQELNNLLDRYDSGNDGYLTDKDLIEEAQRLAEDNLPKESVVSKRMADALAEYEDMQNAYYNENGQRDDDGSDAMIETLRDIAAIKPDSEPNKAQGPIGKTSSPEKIAEEEAKVDTNPTDGQKEAGNYQKGHIKVDGYDITIENPKGSVRRGTDASGKQWESKMHNTYGYIKGTEGVDGDHIDVYLSDNPTSGDVFVIDQIDPATGDFDEHKVMYGFASADEASKAYLSNYERGWKGLGTITPVSREDFKKWIESSHRKTKPFFDYALIRKRQETNTPYTLFEQLVHDEDINVTDPAMKRTLKKIADRIFDAGTSTTLRTPQNYTTKHVNWWGGLKKAERGILQPWANDHEVQVGDDSKAAVWVDEDEQAVYSIKYMPFGVRANDLEAVVVEKKTMTTDYEKQHASMSTGNQEKPKAKKEHKRIVSDEQMEELRKKLLEKFNTANAGIDVERMLIGAMYAVGKIERGVTKFADYAREMVDEIGDAIRPYLKSFYNAVRDMPEAADYRDQMDTAEYVESFDVFNFDKAQAPDVFTKAEQVDKEQKAKRQVKKIKQKQPDLFSGDLFADETASAQPQQAEKPKQEPAKRKEPKLRPATDADLEVESPIVYYEGRPYNVIVITRSGEQISATQFSKPKVESVMLTNGKSVKMEDLMVEDKNAGKKQPKSAWWKDDNRPASIDPSDYESYTTPEAIEYFANFVSQPDEKGRVTDFTKWAHPNLAYITAAVWDEVEIPYEELKEVPEIVEAENTIKSAESKGKLEISDEEANRLAQRLIDSTQARQERKALVVIGLPAGGKSSVFANPLADEYGARIIDSDEVKPWLDGYDGGNGAGYVQDASADVAERAIDIAVKNGDNIIIPRIGGKSVMELSASLRLSGYDVQLYFNDVKGVTSIDRAASRFAQTGRYLSLDYLTEKAGVPSENFSKFAEKTIGSYLDERNQKEIQNIRRRLQRLLGELDGSGEGLRQSSSPEQGGRGTTEELLQTALGSRGLQAGSDGVSLLLEQPLFNYSEWKSNDVPFGEKPKEIWNSESGKPMPGKENKNGNEQKVSRESGAAGEGTEQASGTAGRAGAERSPEPNRAERSGSGHSVENVLRVPDEGEETRDSSGGLTGHSSGDDARVSTTTFHKNRRNNVGERGKDYAPLSPKARFNANVEAIKLMRALMDDIASNPDRVATKEEMAVLRQYSGWGGLGTYFNDDSMSENKLLRELLSEEEYNDAVMSINSAYYTPAMVIDTLWDIAQAMGFKGGNILEGSAGIGNIIGQMPNDISRRSNIEAVEIDAISGNILKLLYPDAKVHIQGFQDTTIRNGSVDLAVTNVPFVTGLHVIDKVDKDLSRKFTNIHDFCIAKNIRKLRDGGIGLFITSSGTLDKSTKLREWITDEGQADVVGAFRLNNETFGGTNVTSDIIVVRKRVGGEKSPNAIDISKASPIKVGSWTDKWGEEHQVSMTVNDYFKEHPEMMAGDMAFGYEKGDTFRPGSYGLYPSKDKNQEKMLAEFASGMSKAKEEKPAADAKGTVAVAENQLTAEKEGRMLVDGNGRLCVSQRGEAVPLGLNDQKVKGYTKKQCFEDYQNVQKAVDDVLQQQLNDPDDTALQPKLDTLNKVFDTFVKRYGNLHKNTAISFLRNDIDFPSFLALENYSETKDLKGKVTVKATKTPLFRQRVLGFKTEPKPKTVKDAVIASIFRTNGIDLKWIAEKLNASEDTKRTEPWTEDDVRKGILVSRLGFEDPSTGQLEIRYKYLSGNVREKLAIAEAYESTEEADGRYKANIEELRKVVPMDIPAHLIDFSLGSSWIPMELYKDYLKENYDLSNVKLTHIEGSWVLDEGNFYRNEKNRTAGVYSEQFKETIYGHQLVAAALNNRPVKVSKQVSEGWGSSKTTKTVTDQAATQACAVRVDEIKEEFRQWAKKKMQDDRSLAERIEKIYNDKFNALVPMTIGDEFLPDTFEDANMNIHLYDHQKRGVLRGVTAPTMLAHEVGTGKSFTLITTAMEMRRLGTARKPMIVVQNATVAQLTSDAKLLYPNAKILSLSEKDRSAEGRRAFYAKIKFNDWDIIIVPQSTFERIPDSPERELQFIQEKIDEKKHIIESAVAAGIDNRELRKLKKELEGLENEYGDKFLGSDPANEGAAPKRKKKDAKKEAAALDKAETRAKEMLDRAVDDVQYFDDLGVDALLVDEAHEYKHLGFQTSIGRGIKGIDPSYSKKCAGLYNKTRCVFEKAGWKNVVFATGTPISNTAAEIWTFMKYLMPADVMRQNDIYYFDDFVHNFGSIQQMLEFSTSGKFKENTRFAAYVNKPELIRIWSQVADTVLTKEVGKVQEKIPELEGGKDQDMFLPQSPSLISIMAAVRAELERFENMTGKEKKENSSIPLTMFGIAKRAAIDPRLVNPDAADEPMSKTNAAVKEIIADLKKTASYNGTVAVFCDNQNRLSNNADGKKVVDFNIFDEMRDKLIKQGVPAEQIAIIKSGMSIVAKQKVFDAVNAGTIRVIMGSTQTLGTGVNIQERLHCLIHMDAPDRPMDYTQRNGRIKRQGNLHKDWGKFIRVIRFGVEDSLDVTAYQRLKTKSGFIDSIMDGKGALANNQVDRTVEEEEEGLFDNPVAVLSGSQYALKKNQAERELRKYQGKKAQWEADQVYVANALRWNEQEVAGTNDRIAKEQKQLEHIKSLFPDGKVKVVTVEGTQVDMGSGDAYGTLSTVIKEKINDPVNATVKRMRETANHGDMELPYTIELDGNAINFKVAVTTTAEWDNTTNKMRNVIHKTVTYTSPSLRIELTDGSSKGVRDLLDEILEQTVTGDDYQDRIDAMQDRVERIRQESEQLQKRVGLEFQFSKELEEAEQRVEEYTELMKQEMAEKEAKYAEQQKNADKVDLSKTESEEDDDLYRDEEDEELLKDSLQSSTSTEILLSLQEKEDDERNEAINELVRRVRAGDARIVRMGQEVQLDGSSDAQIAGTILGGLRQLGLSPLADETLRSVVQGRPEMEGRPEAEGEDTASDKQLAVISWAKATGHYYSEDAVRDSSAGKKLLGSGAESNVYRTADGKKVIKFMALNSYFENSLLKQLDDIALYNAAGFEPLTVLGYAVNSYGQPQIVLEQEYIDGVSVDEVFEDESLARLNSYLDKFIEETLGFERHLDEDGTPVHVKDGIVYKDIHGGNVFMDRNGKLHVIDCYVSRIEDDGQKRADGFSIEDSDTELYRIREEDAPAKTGIGYKVFVLRDGKLYPPMVANPNGEATPVMEWLDADAAPISGTSKTGRPQVKAGGKGTQGGSGQLAYRPGWHLGTIPYALQFNRKDAAGNRTLFPKNFVWAEVEYANDVDYQQEAYNEGVNANGKYQHALAGLKHLPVNGSYRYRTNPDPRTDEWIITGAMKVNRILKPSEVDEMVTAAGREPQPREQGAVTDADVEMLNDVLGMQGSTFREREIPSATDRAEKMQKEIRQRAEATVAALNLQDDVVLLDNAEGLEGRKAKAQGWRDHSTGKIYIVLGNHRSADDVAVTVLHEGVAHYGLRKLFGEHFDQFIENVYNAGSFDVKMAIADKMAKMRANDQRNGRKVRSAEAYRAAATEEYLAKLAEETDFERAASQGWWSRIKDAFFDMLRKVGLPGFNGTLTDNELRYILWRSYENLSETGGERNIMNDAADIDKQLRLKVGNYNNVRTSAQQSAEEEDNDLYRDDEDGTTEPESVARRIYEEAVKDTGDMTMLKALAFALIRGNRTKEQDWTRFKHKFAEAHFDYSRSIKALQDAIESVTGKAVAGFEDVWRSLNAKSSVDSVEIQEVMSKYVEPLSEHVGRMINGKKIDGKAITLDDVEKYMNGVHGIERNVAMAMKQAKDEFEEDTNLLRKQLENTSLTDDERNSLEEALLRKEARFYGIKNYMGYPSVVKWYNEWRRSLERAHANGTISEDDYHKASEKMDAEYNQGWQYKYREKDYAGLTALFSEDFAEDEDITEDMLEQAARDYAAKFEDAVGRDQVAEMWDKVKALNNYSLRKSYLSGIISKQQYDDTLEMYQHYVPLRGWHDDYAGDIYQYISRGEPAEVLQGVLRKAYGRKSRAARIFGTMAAMANTSIVQGNKNIVAQKLLNLASRHPETGLLMVTEQWYQKDANGELIPQFPNLREDMTADEMQAEIERFEAEMKDKQELGEVEPLRKKFGKEFPMHMAKWQEQHHAVRVLRNGKEYMVYVLGNPRAAEAFNGLLNPNSVPSNLVNMLSKYMRFRAKWQTSLSPEFLLSNFQRDVMTASTGAYVKFGQEVQKQFVKNLAKVMPLTAARNLRSGRGVDDIAGIFSLLRKYDAGTLDKNNEMERLFDEFVRNGGMTGISYVTRSEEYQASMEDVVKRMRQGKLAKPRQAMEAVGDAIELANKGIENATRFAMYMTSRQQGRTVVQSIFDAKEASVNFNMKGSGAWGNMWARRLYLYVNPAMQALRMLGTWWENDPVVAAGRGAQIATKAVYHRFMKAATITLTSSVALAVANMLISALLGHGDDDDEGLNTDWWALSEWNRYNYVNVINPFGKGYFHWSLPQEIRPLWAVGQIGVDLVAGKVTYQHAFNAMLSQLNNLSPLAFFEGGTTADDSTISSLIRTFTPTFVAEAADAYGWNRDFMGHPITNQQTWNEESPEWQRALESTPKWAIEASKQWNELTGGRYNKRSPFDGWIGNPSALYYIATQQYGGIGTMAKRLQNLLEQAADPEQNMELRNVPFVPKVYVSTGDDYSKNRLLNEKFWMYWNEFKDADHEMSEDGKKVASGEMTQEEANKTIEERKADGTYHTWEMIDHNNLDNIYKKVRGTDLQQDVKKMIVDAVENGKTPDFDALINNAEDETKRKMWQAAIKKQVTSRYAEMRGDELMNAFDESKNSVERKEIAKRISKEVGCSKDPYGDTPSSDYERLYQELRTANDVLEDAKLFVYQQDAKTVGNEDLFKEVSQERKTLRDYARMLEEGYQGDNAAIMEDLRAERRKLMEYYGIGNR